MKALVSLALVASIPLTASSAFAQSPAAPRAAVSLDSQLHALTLAVQQAQQQNAAATQALAARCGNNATADQLRQVAGLLAKTNEDVVYVRKNTNTWYEDLWFGFASEVVNSTAFSALGFGSEPSTPLWGAAFLSLLLLVLKGLDFIFHRLKPGTKWESFFGKTFGLVISIYLIMLTASLFMLAIQGRGSTLDDYKQQVEASEQLIEQMQSLQEALAASSIAIAKLAAAPVATTTPSKSAAPAAAVNHDAVLKLLERMSDESKASHTAVSQRLSELEQNQHGTLWTWMVGLTAFATICLLGIAAWINRKKLV